MATRHSPGRSKTLHRCNCHWSLPNRHRSRPGCEGLAAAARDRCSRPRRSARPLWVSRRAPRLRVHFCERTDIPAEQRLTIAHEVAHFLADYLLPRQQIMRRLGVEMAAVLDGFGRQLRRSALPLSCPTSASGRMCTYCRGWEQREVTKRNRSCRGPRRSVGHRVGGTAGAHPRYPRRLSGASGVHPESC